jgi:hypothetical protein
MPVEQIDLNDYVEREERLAKADSKAASNYNPSFSTPLSPAEESLYRVWKNQYAPNDESGTYDYRGAFQAGEIPSMPMGHWTDRFKTPTHPTFSNESQYSGAYPERAGTWDGERFIPPSPPPAMPGQLPTPPGTSGYGPVGQAFYNAFQPAPPGTDPMSLRPADLLRQLREGIVSDEDLVEIRKHPFGLTAAAAAANLGIMLSRGAGRGERLNWRIIPGEEWHSWKTVQAPMVGESKSPQGEIQTDVVRPAVRQDPEGNYYEWQGTHVTPGEKIIHDTGVSWGPEKHNIIAIPVEGPTGSQGWKDRQAEWMKQQQGPEPGSPEWFQKKAIDFQAKHGFPPPEKTGPWWEDWKPPEGWPKGDTISPDEMKSMLSDMTGQPFPGKKPPPMTADQLQAELDSLKADFAAGPKQGENKWDFVARIKKAQADLKQKAQDAAAAKQEQIMKGDFSVSKEPPLGPEAQKGPLPQKGSPIPKLTPEEMDLFMRWLHGDPNEPLPDVLREKLRPGQQQPSLQDMYDWYKQHPDEKPPKPPGAPEPPEHVGPVDWNWYEPKGGAIPPYQPPFEVPPGWAPEDMGAHSADFWDRFSWTPPPEGGEKMPPPPNSPDFPGPNRWDYKPPNPDDLDFL